LASPACASSPGATPSSSSSSSSPSSSSSSSLFGGDAARRRVTPGRGSADVAFLVFTPVSETEAVMLCLLFAAWLCCSARLASSIAFSAAAFSSSKAFARAARAACNAGDMAKRPSVEGTFGGVSNGAQCHEPGPGNDSCRSLVRFLEGTVGLDISALGG